MKSITIGAITLVLLCALWSPMPGLAATDNAAKKEGPAMHSYVVFFGFTEQGVKTIKNSPARLDGVKKAIKDNGGVFKSFHGILGSQYDTMVILEAPDDESVAKIVLTVAALGNARSETHRLFTEDEFMKMVSELP